MATAIPAALAGLLEQIRDAVDPDLVSVHDGKPEGDVLPDWIAIGYDPTEGATAVEFAREWAGLGAEQIDEAFTIACVIRSGSGDDDHAAQRTAAIDLLDLVTAAVAADKTLGGAVRVAAVLGNGSIVQAETQAGAAAGVRFVVGCEATISQT